MSGAICGGNYIYRRKVGKCYGACGIEDSALAVSEGNPYYAPAVRCTNCGDGWSEEMFTRPFRRGWRHEAIADACDRWELACSCPVERDEDFYPIPCEHAREVRS